MNSKVFVVLHYFFIIVPPLCGQGTLVFDQQSDTNETPYWGTGATMQQIPSPWGQSFTPALSAVDFMQLKTYDGNTNNVLGAILYINLRAGSIGGQVLGSTIPLPLSNGFGGVTNFFFPGPVAVTPGQPYYFEPVVQSDDPWLIDSGPYGYLGGTAFQQGLPLTGSDIWFREGIVPEPSSATLAFVTGIVFVWLRDRNRRGGENPTC